MTRFRLLREEHERSLQSVAIEIPSFIHQETHGDSPCVSLDGPVIFPKLLAAIVMMMIMMPVMTVMPMSNSNHHLSTRWNCQRCKEKQKQ